MGNLTNWVKAGALAVLLAGCDGGSSTDVFEQNTGQNQLAAPRAVNDTYNHVGLGALVVTAANGVRANDVHNGAPVVAFQNPSAGGGNVSVQADGAFTYVPPANAAGPDTFTYQIANAGGSSNATVTIINTGGVIFVNSTAAAGGNGTQGAPFQSLAAAANAIASGPNLSVVVAVGNGTAYTGPVTLLNNQTLRGQDAANPPLLSGPVTVGNRATLASLRFGNVTGTAVNATNVDTFTLANVAVNNASTGGVLLGNVTGNVSLVGLNLTNITGNALEARGGSGNLTLATVNASNVTGDGVLIRDRAGTAVAANVSLANVGRSGFHSVNNGTGPLALNVTGLTVNGAGNVGFGNGTGFDLLAAGGSVVTARVTNSTISLNNTFGVALNSTDSSNVTVRLEGLTINNGVNRGVLGTANGTSSMIVGVINPGALPVIATDFSTLGAARMGLLFTGVQTRFLFVNGGSTAGNIIVDNLNAVIANNTFISNGNVQNGTVVVP